MKFNHPVQVQCDVCKKPSIAMRVVSALPTGEASKIAPPKGWRYVSIEPGVTLLGAQRRPTREIDLFDDDRAKLASLIGAPVQVLRCEKCQTRATEAA